jgi:hypothetical protein
MGLRDERAPLLAGYHRLKMRLSLLSTFFTRSRNLRPLLPAVVPPVPGCAGAAVAGAGVAGAGVVWGRVTAPLARHVAAWATMFVRLW